MAAPVFNTLSDYLGTSFVRQSDGLVSSYGNVTGAVRPSGTRWTISVTNTPVTWNLVSGSITPVSSTTSTYTFDFVPTVEGDYSFTIEAINSDGTTSKTYTIGVGRQPNNNDFATVGPYDQWVFNKDTNEQVIGPAFVGNSVNPNGWSNPFAPGIQLVLNSSGAAAPNFALNVNPGPSDIGYGICPPGTYTVPVKGLNTGSITPPGYTTFNIVFTIIDTSPPAADVTELVSDTLALSDDLRFPINTITASDTLTLSDTISEYTGIPNTVSDTNNNWDDSVSTQMSVISSGTPPSVSGNPPADRKLPPNSPPVAGTSCIFEFYGMETPEEVEVLPVPKKYDQLGPMRFDKIGKIFGFRVRLIPNGAISSMPYAIYGDDSESSPHLNSALFTGTFAVRSGFDNVYEIQLPKSINTDIFRLTLGPTTDSFHRYNVLVKVHISGMQGQAKWLPIR